MSDDNLESLDNASLRAKCLEFGLPNVPITDTSRALLIRKLRVAMTGKPADKDKKKNRRETIHVSKVPSPVETAPVEAPKRPPSQNSRRTIAITSVTSTVDDKTLPAATKPAPVADRRRSVRSQEAPATIPVAQQRKTNIVLIEEAEDDDDDVILLEAAEKGEQEQREIILPRTRRSVSLSKTGVVTTSYSQESSAVPPTVNETESESDNDFTSRYASTYEPISRPLPKPQPPIETTWGFTQRKVLPEPERVSSFRTSTVNRTSIEPEPIYKPSLPSTARYSTIGSAYPSNSAASITTSSTTRRFTSGGYGGSNTMSTKYTTGAYDDEDDEQEETPYLSDFARKLERLKSEPLVKGVESPRNIPIKRETQRYTPSSIVGRRSTIQKDSVAESFKSFILALDRKYNLKRNFAIAFGIILFLFIYVVFIR